MTQKNRKKRKKLRAPILIGLAFLITLIGLLMIIPREITDANLRSLGYKEEDIKAIRSQNLTNLILEKEYYSPYLAAEIRNEHLNLDYIELYTLRTVDNPLTAKDFNLYARLKDAGYDEHQLLRLFDQLQFFEMTPLLVYDYQYEDTLYIKDCINHRDTNSIASFHLSRSYLQKYKISDPIEDINNTTLVNCFHYLPEDYEPEDLQDLAVTYATYGQSLQAEAASAFLNFAIAGSNAGYPFYCITSYRSYDSQKTSYESALKSNTQAVADQLTIRPGYSEHQLGLAVNVTPTKLEEDETFLTSNARLWLTSNCATYGFIERYPPDKGDITHIYDEPDHFRYVGVDLAQEVYQTGMTYDEYYALYLAPWDNENNRPDDKILRQLPVPASMMKQTLKPTEEVQSE